MHLKTPKGKISPRQWIEGLYALNPSYSKIRTAVETGTFRGDGPLWFSEFFDAFHTVEINKGFHELAQSRCARSPYRERMTFHLGDSAAVVPVLADLIKAPVFWMLDAHYCKWCKSEEWNEPHPEKGKFPLWEELAAISTRPYADIVLIDDSPLFGVDRSGDRAPGDTGPQWESICDDTVIKALGGRVTGAQEWCKSRVYWRSAV